MSETHSPQAVSQSTSIRRGLISVVTVSAYLLILKVLAEILWQYRDYFPPRFASGFLSGRESYFWGAYSGAFYLHLATGPLSLVLGFLLASPTLRRLRPAWHRRIGVVQAIIVLFGVAPSGLWMAWYAETGAVAAAALGALALTTAICVWCGWQAARRRAWATHQDWMERTLVLLASAIVLRLIGGAAAVLNCHADWLYPASTWACWCLPLALRELVRRVL